MDFISEIFTWSNLLSLVTEDESRDEIRLPQTNLSLFFASAFRVWHSRA